MKKFSKVFAENENFDRSNGSVIHWDMMKVDWSSIYQKWLYMHWNQRICSASHEKSVQTKNKTNTEYLYARCLDKKVVSCETSQIPKKWKEIIFFRTFIIILFLFLFLFFLYYYYYYYLLLLFLYQNAKSTM